MHANLGSLHNSQTQLRAFALALPELPGCKIGSFLFFLPQSKYNPEEKAFS
jgi:hypothetical protein